MSREAVEYEILYAADLEWAVEACVLMCEQYGKESANFMVITREMALDAGDPSLEGTIWSW